MTSFISSVRPGGGITVLVLDHRAIGMMYVPGGITYRFFNQVAREIQVAASAKLVPGHGYRTGELQRSLGHSVTPIPSGLLAHVRATAAHAVYYHEGTADKGMGRIYPKNSRRLRFYSLGKLWVLRSVRGQRGHPFIDEAKSEVLRARGITGM